MYASGKGVPLNMEKSFEWYLQAANQGFAPAQYNVGVAYDLGRGVEKNNDQKFIWYKKAADQGLLAAYVGLGYAYKYGEGTEDKALEYFLLAAEEGYMGGIYESIVMFYHRYNDEGRKDIYNTIYYCKKYIKLSETEEFDDHHKAFVTGVLSEQSSICRTCGDKGKKKKYCSKCTCVFYCSLNCQRKDWKENGHKEECKKIEF